MLKESNTGNDSIIYFTKKERTVKFSLLIGLKIQVRKPKAFILVSLFIVVVISFIDYH
jgi:hypothetical protein